MRFVTIAVKNLARRPGRSLLTVAGLAVAIAAVVSLVGAAESLEKSYLALYESRGGDLVVQRRGGAVQVSRGMSESFGNRIRALPQAGVVTGGLLDIVSFEDQGLYTVFVEGLPQNDEAVLGRIKVLSGRRLESSDKDCVMLGRILAANLGKRAGETVEIYARKFPVVGVYETSNVYENGSVFMRLADLQRQIDRPGQVTGFLVQANPPGDAAAIAALQREIEKLDPSVAAIPCAEFVRSVSQLQVTHTISWVISSMAGLIGALGVLNTMAINVFERRAEIGALRAMGWRKSRVVRLILNESLALAVLGLVVGIPCGIGLMYFMEHWHVTSSLVQGSASLATIGKAALMAAAMATIGALLPALRSASVPPVKALRGS
jgi:putative ABC transport system permease protein